MNDYEFLTQIGICHKCRREKVAPGKKFCFDCLEKIRVENRRRYDPEKAKQYQARRRELYSQKKVAGICIRCNKPATHGLYCYEHSIKEKKKSQNRAERAKRIRHERGLIPEKRNEMGLCLWCGRPAVSGKKCCEVCAGKFKEAGRKANNKENPFANEVKNYWKKK